MKFSKALLSGLLVLPLAAPVAAKQYSVEDFFKNPQYTQMSISPNGEYLAALAPVEIDGKSRRNIAIINLEDRSKSKFITALDDQDVANFGWINDERLLFGVDSDGIEAIALYAVDREGKKIRDLINPLGRSMRGKGSQEGGGRDLPSPTVIDILEEDDKHMLVGYDSRRVGQPDVYRLNVHNGGMKMVERNPGNVQNWFTDHDGKLRGAVAQDGLFMEVLYRPEGEGEWKTVSRYRYDDPNGITPVGFAYDNKTWYVASSKDHDTAAIYTFNPETGEFGEEIFHHKEVDAGGLVYSDKKEKVVAATYVADKPGWVPMDSEYGALRKGLENAFPDHFVSISSMNEDEDRMVISVSSDTDPGGYYLFYKDEGRLEPLGTRMPWIEPEEMAPMKPISYTARDGMTIHGYLTVPPDSDGKNLPLIVNPHGGPWARDSWGFNPEHQFFANRGYAVLQMNFRGSTGYGHEHLTSSKKQWGRKMQDDITDGVKWAIEQGIANEDRVCIYGGSYGGYATMAGLTFTPDLYQCGINYVGVTDLELLYETMPERWMLGKEVWADRVGDPETEKEFLAEISPLNHVDKIKAPVFIVHGDKDPRVNIRHATKLKDEMEKHNKPYEWMVKYDEGHGFRKQENRIELYTQMEEFFDEHIGGKGSTGP